MSLPEHPPRPSAAQIEIIEIAAKVALRLGFAPTTGQVYGLLFATPKPMCLDSLAQALSISKTSAGTAIRQLGSLNAIRQVWLPGTRKAHFEARTDLREVLRANYHSLLRAPADRAKSRLDVLLEALETDLSRGDLDTEAYACAKSRIQALQAAHRGLVELLPLIERLLSDPIHA